MHCPGHLLVKRPAKRAWPAVLPPAAPVHGSHEGLHVCFLPPLCMAAMRACMFAPCRPCAWQPGKCVCLLPALRTFVPCRPCPMQANKRIDGLYIYVAPPSLVDLAARIRGRLKEAESTLQLRLEWARAQVAEVRAGSLRRWKWVQGRGGRERRSRLGSASACSPSGSG